MVYNTPAVTFLRATPKPRDPFRLENGKPERALTSLLIAPAASAVACFFDAARTTPEECAEMADSKQRESSEQAVLRVERETMEAIRDKEVRALGRILADEFVYLTPAGAELGKAEFLESVASLPAQIVSVGGEQLRARIFGETAVLTGVQRARVRTDEAVEVESLVAFTDVFVKHGGRWRLTLAYGVEIPFINAEPPAKQE
jgi:ketosteroid isomerase-like protein